MHVQGLRTVLHSRPPTLQPGRRPLVREPRQSFRMTITVCSLLLVITLADPAQNSTPPLWTRPHPCTQLTQCSGVMSSTASMVKFQCLDFPTTLAKAPPLCESKLARGHNLTKLQSMCSRRAQLLEAFEKQSSRMVPAVRTSSVWETIMPKSLLLPQADHETVVSTRAVGAPSPWKLDTACAGRADILKHIEI